MQCNKSHTVHNPRSRYCHAHALFVYRSRDPKLDLWYICHVINVAQSENENKINNGRSTTTFVLFELLHAVCEPM